MEWYYYLIIALSTIIALTLCFYIVGSYAFFIGIFKRKPYNELGDKKHETPQRKEVKRQRALAIKHARELPFESLSIHTNDGLTLKGRLFKSSLCQNNHNLVICVHGFTSHGLREFSAYLPTFDNLGLDALVVDDRAHGDSEGKYTGFSVLDRQDVQLWVKSQQSNYDKIYLFGISMGAATIAMVAGDMGDQIAGAIFDCGFTSPMDSFNAAIKNKTLRLLAAPIFFFGRIWCKTICGFDYKKCSAEDVIKSATCPFLFIQGDKDPTVPKPLSDRMYAACGSEYKKQEIFEGAEHVASFYIDRPRYVALLTDFFGKF